MLFDLSLITSFLAILLLAMGWGSVTAMSDQVLSTSTASLTSGQIQTGNALFLNDGYVALNHSVGVIQTLRKYPLQSWDSLNRDSSGNASYFSEVMVVGSNLTNVKDLHVDIRGIYTVAPVLQSKPDCLVDSNPISSKCADTITILGWAFTQSSSLCTTLGMSVCSQSDPLILHPQYDCNKNNGLCAVVTSQPADEVVSNIMSRFAANNWPKSTTGLWLQVNSLSTCDTDPATCTAIYSVIGSFGVCVAVLSLVLMVTVFHLDVRMDDLISDILDRHV